MFSKIFGMDGKYTNIASKLADIFILNMLWILTSLFVVTIVPSTSAFYYAIVKSVRKERGTPVENFLYFFKNNLKNGIFVSIIYLFIAAVVAFNYFSTTKMNPASSIYMIYKVEALWVIVLFVFLSIFLFPVFSRFEYGIFQYIKVSLFIGVRHTLTSIFISLAMLGVIIFIAKYLFFIIIVPGIMLTFLSVKIEKIMKKYMKKPEEGEMIPWYWE